MLCLVTYKYKQYNIVKKEDEIIVKKEYFLIEKHKISNGFMFTMNDRFFYDYDFIWNNDNENHWEILYKKNVE